VCNSGKPIACQYLKTKEKKIVVSYTYSVRQPSLGLNRDSQKQANPETLTIQLSYAGGPSSF
jgi:hypothetical protein